MCGEMKLGQINAKRGQHKGIVVPIVLYGAETWHMKAAQRRLHVMEILEKYVWSHINRSCD